MLNMNRSGICRTANQNLARRCRPAIATAALVLFAISSCSSDPEPIEARPFAAYVDEFVALTADDALVRARWNAQQDFIAECMTDRGHTYERPAEPETFTKDRVPGWDFLVLSADDAEATGLGIVINPAVAAEDPERRGGSVAYLDDLLGSFDPDAEPGCSPSAVWQVGATSIEEANTHGLLNFDRDDEARKFQTFVNDPEVVDASSRWTTCMADADMGSQLQSPFAADQISTNFWNDVVAASDLDYTADSTLDEDDYRQLFPLEQSYARAFITCLEPEREVLRSKFAAITGHNP